MSDLTPGTSSLPAPTAAAVSARRPSSAWALATPLIALILVVGIPMGYMVITWTQRVAGAPGRFGAAMTQMAAEAVQPKISINAIVLNSLEDMKKTNKLVVAEPEINVDVTIEDSYSSWGVYWGTNVARVVARGVKTQFYVDMSKLETSNFDYNANTRILTVRVPTPRLDTQMVAVDPRKIQTSDLRGGWSRFDKQETRDHAMAEIVPHAIAQANTPFTQRLAREAGMDALTKFLEPLSSEMARDGVTVQIKYEEN